MKITDIRSMLDSGNVACPLCGADAEVIQRSPGSFFIGLRCPNCLSYYLKGSVFDTFDDAEHLYLFSGYLRHFWSEDNVFQCFDSNEISRIIQEEQKIENDNRKMAFMIFYYAQMIECFDDWCSFEPFPAIAYCNGTEELTKIAQMAAEKGFVKLNDDLSQINITRSGVEFSKLERKK